MANLLSEVLENYEFATLLSMLAFNGVKNPGRLSKPELIAALNKVLLDPARVTAKVAKLARGARETLVVLQRQSGEASRGAISRRLRDLDLLDASIYRQDINSSRAADHKNADSRYLDEILAHLQALGLVFGRLAPDPWGRTNALTYRLTLSYLIPQELLPLLPPPPPAPSVLDTLPPPAQILESSARTFQRDLYIYWSYVDRNRPELIAKGLLAKRHLTAVNETLLQRETITTGQSESDFPRLMFLRQILTQLGLIKVTPNGFGLQSCPAESFFGLEPLERIRRTYTSHIENRLTNELLQFSSISTFGEPVLPVPDRLVAARRAVAAALSLTHGWTALAAVCEYLREYQYEFFLQRTYRGNSYRDSYYYAPMHPYAASGNPLGWEWGFAPNLDEGEGWQRVEKPLIVWHVTQPLHWMGLVDLGMRPVSAKKDTQEIEPASFQFTPLGRWLLANGPAPEIPVGGGQVIVQPDFTILAFDPISDVVLYHLEQFARRVSAERAILFRVSQQSIYAGQQAGWDVPRVLAYLEELSHQPLPANLVRTLTEWQGSHERIRIFPGVNVLHAAAPDLAALAAQPATQALLARQVAPEVVVLPADKKLSALKQRFIEAGWWPVISSPSDALPARSVRLEEDGRLLFLHARPGLYLRAHLARFAELSEAGYRLTPASVRRAVNAGLAANQVVTELERVLEQPVPPEQAQRLLAWSGFFGQVESETTTLLRFKNAAALEEFRRNPQVNALLHPLRPEDAQRLALVRPKDLDKLRKLFTELGVEWKE